MCEPDCKYAEMKGGSVLDKKLDEFIVTMKWSREATEREKTLVVGNLRGFVSFVKNKKDFMAAERKTRSSRRAQSTPARETEEENR